MFNKKDYFNIGKNGAVADVQKDFAKPKGGADRRKNYTAALPKPSMKAALKIFKPFWLIGITPAGGPTKDLPLPLFVIWSKGAMIPLM